MVGKTAGICAGAAAVLVAGAACFFMAAPHSSAPIASSTSTASAQTNAQEQVPSTGALGSQNTPSTQEESTDLVTAATNAINDVKNDAINAAIDASGTKAAVENALLAHVTDISNATGLNNSQVNTIIKDMDIESWEVTNLPSDATETGTVSGSYAGVDASLTTYDSPNYVTVNAYGQDFTLAVPQSAQQYLPLLAYAS